MALVERIQPPHVIIDPTNTETHQTRADIQTKDNHPSFVLLSANLADMIEATEIVMYEMLLSMNERQGQHGRERLLYYQWGVLPGGMIRRDTRAGWFLWKLLE